MTKPLVKENFRNERPLFGSSMLVNSFNLAAKITISDKHVENGPYYVLFKFKC